MLIINIIIYRDNIMNLINVNVSEISELNHFILLTYSAVKITAALMKDFNAVKQKKLIFL